MAGDDDALPLWFRLGIALVVLGLWSASVIVDMLSSAYDTPTPIHGIAAIVVSFIFGREVGRAVKGRIKNGG